ncbi:peroxiredoxin family protein [Mucilaginibacter sp. SP1R1]|uniref:peroxiredoxin family protein n=1 Tax=Mucilaginibacter sp. SP1R1 TaxID=2723091 RepID=UPI0016209091|nr:TlpA disulfide reductase family protein [Mucilaginibacter sp. SP1R1]MBB6149701.1 peroxiredoxin [Mucilaginibacter sp. SP1R1]
MPCTKLIKLLIYIAFILTGLKANAQVAILQNAIDKLESYKNFSYEYVYKQKEVFSDTLIYNQKFVLLKTPEDKAFGYFFRHELKYGDAKVTSTDLYNGTDLISLFPRDSTYNTRNVQAITFSQSLPGELNWIKTFLKKHPSKIAQSNDTSFNSINSYHLIVNTKDTIINKDHLYVRIHLFIDKATGLPVGKLTRSRTADFGKEVTNYYTEETYFNYKIDQDNINVASFAMPEGFHAPKEKPKEQSALLTQGMIAPDWTLYDTDGKKASLSQMKGKVVLLDFFFVGCVYCMNTLAPLDNLHEKYKNKNLVILSISDRDSKKLVTAFKKAQCIKNQMFPNARDVANLYQVTAAPTFYFIDQEGKIANIVDGYSEDFETKMSAIIDSLLKKS